MTDIEKGRGAAEAGGPLLFTSSIAQLAQGRAVVLLAAQPDPRQAAAYLLEATVVAEQPVQEPLRLVAEWGEERRTAPVDRAGVAHLRGIPSEVLQALQAGDPRALVLRIENASEGDALG